MLRWGIVAPLMGGAQRDVWKSLCKACFKDLMAERVSGRISTQLHVVRNLTDGRFKFLKAWRKKKTVL